MLEIRRVAARAFEANADAFSSWVGPMDGAVRRGAAMTLVASGSPLPFFNQAIAIAELPDPEAAIAEAIEFLDERVRGYILMLLGDDARAHDAARAAGFRSGEEVPLMVLPTATLGEWPAPPGFEIRTDRESLDSLFGVGFVDDPAARGPFQDVMRAASSTGWDVFGGFLDGEGVATSASYTTGDCVGVFSVGTVPSARGRGIGAAMTARAVRAGAARGAELAYLFASTMGRPVYERMGFEVVASHRIFGRASKETPDTP